jgi:ribosomal 50S subunit-recycling heat shock protein
MGNIDIELSKIADELNISDSKYEAAENSYKAVGAFLCNNMGAKVRIFPQGSFRLGTVIKPLKGGDGDYDIDLVCVIDKKYNTPASLKNDIGNHLKQSKWRDLINPKEGGNRCWTLEYQNDYHLDILPAIESSNYSISKELKITDKREPDFISTNPEKYYEWFIAKIEKERKRILDEAKHLDSKIDNIPEYKIKSTLQKTIQILKRYRDEMFKNDEDNKPISIIITTILATLYSGESSITMLIKKFINNWSSCFKIENGVYILANPVNQKENFADKWVTHIKRKNNFFAFVNKLKVDFMTNEKILQESTKVKVSDSLKTMFGSQIIDSIISKEAESMKKARESGNAFVNNNGQINEKEGTKIKQHTFYGKNKK